MSSLFTRLLTVLVSSLLLAEQSCAQIQRSVGADGVNQSADVETVQRLLNSISNISGGPDMDLDVDGKVGPATIAAIKHFQTTQLGFQDGKIDPRQNTELRLLRMNGIHEVLGTADSEDEKKLAEFTTSFSCIVVAVDGKSASVRPPYHINTGKRKAKAEENRRDDPTVANLLKKCVGNGGAMVGKATPDEIQQVLQSAIDANLVTPRTPDGMRAFLSKYGVSTDCSGLASRACNLLSPVAPLDVVGKANTASLAKLTKVSSPADLKAGDMMVKGGSHVRLLTDVDVTPAGIEFTTLESTASSVLANGDGVGERRWRFPKLDEFIDLEQASADSFAEASESDRSYIYTRK